MEEEVKKEENKPVITKTSEDSAFKEIGSSLPILTVIIIILGLIKLIVYYTKYNVPIKYFIQISELGLIVSSDLCVPAGFSQPVLIH